MKGDVSELPNEAIEERIRELETAYAEFLKDRAEEKSLYRIWKRIRELRDELAKRKNSSSI